MASTIQGDKIQDTGGNTILSSNSTGTFTYVQGTGMGKVLQVLQGSTTDTTTVSGTSYVDVSLSQAITPASTSNKIFIMVYAFVGVPASGSGGDDHFLTLLRDSTNIGGAGSVDSDAYALINETGGQYDGRYTTFTYLDSPSSTSAITYKIQMRNRNSSKTSYFNRRGGDTLSGISYITCMEVAG